MKALAFALLLLPAQDKPKAGESPYYPLKVGTTWTFVISAVKLTNRVVRHERVGEVMCARIESRRNGTVVANEHVAATEDGIYRYAYNGARLDPPVLILKLPPASGDSWEIDSSVEGGQERIQGSFTVAEEEVTVPAGKYKTFTSAGETAAGGMNIETKYYFAENVGIVKQWFRVGETEAAAELEKFEPGR